MCLVSNWQKLNECQRSEKRWYIGSSRAPRSYLSRRRDSRQRPPHKPALSIELLERTKDCGLLVAMVTRVLRT